MYTRRTCRSLVGGNSSSSSTSSSPSSVAGRVPESAHSATTAVPWIVSAMNPSMSGRPKLTDTGCRPRERLLLLLFLDGRRWGCHSPRAACQKNTGYWKNLPYQNHTRKSFFPGVSVPARRARSVTDFCANRRGQKLAGMPNTVPCGIL